MREKKKQIERYLEDKKAAHEHNEKNNQSLTDEHYKRVMEAAIKKADAIEPSSGHLYQKNDNINNLLHRKGIEKSHTTHLGIEWFCHDVRTDLTWLWQAEEPNNVFRYSFLPACFFRTPLLEIFIIDWTWVLYVTYNAQILNKIFQLQPTYAPLSRQLMLTSQHNYTQGTEPAYNPKIYEKKNTIGNSQGSGKISEEERSF